MGDSASQPNKLRRSLRLGNAKSYNPIALRKAKIVYNFGLSECNRVKQN